MLDPLQLSSFPQISTDVCGCRTPTKLHCSPGASVKLTALTRLRLPVCSVCSPRVHCRKNRTITRRALGWEHNVSPSSAALPLPATGCELCSQRGEPQGSGLSRQLCLISSQNLPAAVCVLSGLPATAVPPTDLVSIADLFYFFILVCYNHRFSQLEVTNGHSLQSEIFMSVMQ